MKLPSISFDKEAILGFFLEHGEKIGVAVVGALACGLVWGGVNAVRTKSATRGQLPAFIVEQADSAAAHIGAVKQPPAEEIKRSNLLESIAAWRKPEVRQSQQPALFNKPLFEERSKRSKPEVFPIEDLRAVAGIAFLAEPAGDAKPGRGADVDGPEGAGRQPGGAKRPRGERPGPPAGPPGAGPPEFDPRMGGQPAEAAPGRGRLVPYCVVTGLIPVAKQTRDYQERFGQAGFRSPEGDVPRWSDFLVERTVVSSGGKEDWKRIDLKQFFALVNTQSKFIQGEAMPPEFLLTNNQYRGAEFGYCSPLPQLAADSWGVEALHPWFVGQMRKQQDEQEQPGAPGAFDANGPESGLREPTAGPERNPAAADSLDYRLFRFVDTTVETGKTYRYRVRLSLWNPNYELEPRYLADAEIAKGSKLASAASNESEPVTVPGTSAILVRTLQKAETKRFKPGVVEVLVLDAGSQTGGYALRSLVTEPGGLVNVDKRLNKPGDARTRGEDVFTEAVLVDVRGKQEDRAEARGGRPSPPPEPLDMLFLRPDGSFAIASAADGQLRVERYRQTLPEPDNPKAGRENQPPANPAPESPFGNPFK